MESVLFGRESARFLRRLFLVFSDIKWKTIPQTGWSKHLISVLRGVLIAAPILLIFGALFVAADAVFQGIIEQTFNIRADIVFSHILLIGVFLVDHRRIFARFAD